MRVLKDISMDQFEKCGDIVVAARRNKLAMSCSFCQKMFEQLQAFVRHLQLQHNDKLDFVKQAKEVEVYAVEELMSQTLASCTSDIQNEGFGLTEDWLTNDDMKWLDEGIEPKEKHQSEAEYVEEEECLNMTNISILKAFEDCDVSLKLMDNVSNTKCSDDGDQGDSQNALWQEINNDWEDNDTNGSIQNSIDFTDTEMSNFTKHLMDISKELEDLPMPELPLNSICVEENINAVKKKVENCQSQCIKRLLQGVEDLDDVDSLLANLERSSITSEKNTKEKFSCNKNFSKNQNLKIKNDSNNGKVLLNTKLVQKSNQNELENLVETNKLQNISLGSESEKVEDFETRLRELEDALDADIINSNDIESKMPICARIAKNTKLECSNQNDVELKLKDLVDSVHSDLGKYIEHLKESLDETEKTIEITTELLDESEENVLSKTHLNEEFEKVFGEDITYSNEAEMKKPISEKIAENTIVKCSKQNDMEIKLKDLEDSENDNSDCHNYITNNNMVCYVDSGKQFENFKESLDETGKDIKITTELLKEKETNALSETPLNEDLEKVLADALDDDLDLLNLQLEEESEEPLNEDILNLLERELVEKEIEPQLPIHKEQTTLDAKINLKENKVTNMQSFENMNKNNAVMKYQKTNLKAKTKIYEVQNKSLLKPSISSVLKQSNVINSGHNAKDSQKPLKTHPEMCFLTQKELTSLKSPTKTYRIENTNEKISSNLWQRKTPNKENQQNYIPTKNIGQIKPTSALNFINTDRGRKTPVKRESVVIKYSPKKDENFPTINIVQIKPTSASSNFINTDRGHKTPVKRESMVLKYSPKTNENAPTINIGQFKPTSGSYFINTDRGHKTHVKRESMLLKYSPKTKENNPSINIGQIKPMSASNFINTDGGHKTPIKRGAKRETASNVTPKRGEKTPQDVKINISPRTQEKKEHLIPQYTPPHDLTKSPPSQEKSIEHQNNKTPKTPRNNNFITKESKSKSSLTSSIGKPTSPTKAVINSRANTHLKTPQRVKNLAIKLQRFTPDKLGHILKNKEKISVEHGSNKIEHFKLPKGISLTRVPKQNSSVVDNQCKVTETPVKATYCKQNFSECDLENIQRKETQEHNSDLHKSNLRGAQPQIKNNLKQTESKILNMRQRKASIDIVTPTQENPNQTIQISANKTPCSSNLDYKSYAVNRSFRKKEVLQRMRNIKKQIFKSIGESECVTNVRDMKSPAMMRQKKQNVCIQNVTILPNLKNDAVVPLKCHNLKNPLGNNTAAATTISVSPKNLISLQRANNVSLDNGNENFIITSSKRKASSPLLNENKQAKHEKKSPENKQNEVVRKISGLEAEQFDLSESAVDFLQRDLKANRINVENLLNEALVVDDDCSPNKTYVQSNSKDEKVVQTEKDDSSYLINDLLRQVDNEKNIQEKTENVNATKTSEALTKPNLFEDFNESKDINLLSKFGLKIIKFPEVEDVISLEERDEMHKKANEFANIYKNYPKIWATKNSESFAMKEELDISFKQLLTQTKTSFNLDISIEEVKRLANIINLWYTHSFRSKLIEKEKFSDALNRYILMFYFMPKTIKRFHFCEYCEEYFNTEHKYFTHRIIHTGDLFPYTCQKCCMGFRVIKQLKNHELSCNYVKSSVGHKCLACSEIFASSKLLYEHSKTHLTTVYHCAKCELVFASAMDVQNHVGVCHNNQKRILKQYTPRPAKTKAQSHIHT